MELCRVPAAAKAGCYGVRPILMPRGQLTLIAASDLPDNGRGNGLAAMPATVKAVLRRAEGGLVFFLFVGSFLHLCERINDLTDICSTRQIETSLRLPDQHTRFFCVTLRDTLPHIRGIFYGLQASSQSNNNVIYCTTLRKNPVLFYPSAGVLPLFIRIPYLFGEGGFADLDAIGHALQYFFFLSLLWTDERFLRGPHGAHGNFLQTFQNAALLPKGRGWSIGFDFGVTFGLFRSIFGWRGRRPLRLRRHCDRAVGHPTERRQHAISNPGGADSGGLPY